MFSDFVSFLLLLDCQEAFHCCLVVTCINRINMISIECHRVGEWWPGKREVDNRIESGQGKSCGYSLYNLILTIVCIQLSYPERGLYNRVINHNH